MIFNCLLFASLPSTYNYKNIELTMGLDRETTPDMQIIRHKLINNVLGLQDTKVRVLIQEQNGTPICKYEAREAAFNIFHVENHRIRGIQIYWSLGVEKRYKVTSYSLYKIKNGEKTFIHSHFIGPRNTIDIHYLDD